MVHLDGYRLLSVLSFSSSYFDYKTEYVVIHLKDAIRNLVDVVGRIK